MAIAFDAATDGGATAGATSWTFAHARSGTDPILHVAFLGDVSGGVDDVTSVTYSGIAMTLVGKREGTSTRWLYLYELVAPAAGTNNVVVTFGSSHFIAAIAASHTGAAQTGQPNTSATKDSVTDVTSQTETLTTSVDNCWLVMAACAGNGSMTDDGGTSSVERVESNQFVLALYDSGAAKTPTGAHAITFNAANAHLSSVTAAIAPVAGGGGGGAGVGRRALLGVGR